MKIDPNLLPAPELRVEEVRCPVPGQGEFLIHLRQPAFSEFLLVQSAASAAIEKWCQPGADWYPATPPVAPSPALWQSVTVIERLQCDAEGNELPVGDPARYVEAELVPLLGRSPAIFAAAGAAVMKIMAAAGDELGNGLEAAGAKASEPASNTDTSTPT